MNTGILLGRWRNVSGRLYCATSTDRLLTLVKTLNWKLGSSDVTIAVKNNAYALLCYVVLCVVTNFSEESAATIFRVWDGGRQLLPSLAQPPATLHGAVSQHATILIQLKNQIEQHRAWLWVTSIQFTSLHCVFPNVTQYHPPTSFLAYQEIPPPPHFPKFRALSSLFSIWAACPS